MGELIQLRNGNSECVADESFVIHLKVSDLRQLLREEIQAVTTSNVGNPGPASQESPYLSVKQAAVIAGVGASTLRSHIAKGHLVANRIGRRVVVSRVALNRFLQANPTSSA